jgi:hypothetical protein
MKRIVVGLMILGLVIGGFLSCVLNAPDTVDQTQVDGLLATLSADGAFGQEISRSVESGTVIDGWEYNSAGALGDATIKTLTFMTDGTWEYKLESYEAAALTSTVHASQDVENENLNGTSGEAAFVQNGGYKGTYSYDADTKILTVNWGGIQWENGTTPKYLGVWDNTTNVAAGTEMVMKSKPFVFTLFDDSILDDDDVNGIVGIDISADVLNAFDEYVDEDNPGDGLKFIGADGSYTIVEKELTNSDATAFDYDITTVTEMVTLSETMMTYYKTQVVKNDFATGTDTYAGTPVTHTKEYDVVWDMPLADMGWSMFDEAYLTKTYVLTADNTDGTFDQSTTYVATYEDVSADPFVVNGISAVKMFGDGYLFY